MDTAVPVEHNISRPPTTNANTMKNYAPPNLSHPKKKQIGPGGIAFIVGGGTLMATGVALFVAIRLNILHAQSRNLKNTEGSHSSLLSHPTSATIGNIHKIHMD